MRSLPSLTYAKFYKYRPFDDYTKALLLSGEAYFSRPADLNDPFECVPPSIPEPNAQQVRKWMEFSAMRTTATGKCSKQLADLAISTSKKFDDDTARRFVRAVIDSVTRDITHNSSMYCLTSVNDSSLMFAHYADGHRGICVEYEFTLDYFLGNPNVVTYTDQIASVDFWDDDLFDGPLLTEKTIFTKARCWEYEKEWRIFDYGVPCGVREIDPRCISGVILGCKASDLTKKTVRDLSAARVSPFAIHQAKMTPDKYSLEIIRLF